MKLACSSAEPQHRLQRLDRRTDRRCGCRSRQSPAASAESSAAGSDSGSTTTRRRCSAAAPASIGRHQDGRPTTLRGSDELHHRHPSDRAPRRAPVEVWKRASGSGCTQRAIRVVDAPPESSDRTRAHRRRRLIDAAFRSSSSGLSTRCAAMPLAHQHVCEDQPEGVDIGSLIDRLASRLLRRHVLHRADHRAGHRRLGRRGWPSTCRDAGRQARPALPATPWIARCRSP